MELQNKSASLVVIFALFCFVFIYDESMTSSFNQKYRKSFHSCDKNKLFRYDVIRGIQQTTKHSFFFFFFGNQRGNQKKTRFALFGSRSRHRFSCSLAGPTTTSKQQRNWENLSTKVKKIQHQNHDDYNFLITYKREPRQRHD